MAKPKRLKVYNEAQVLAKSWLNGNKFEVIGAVTRPGPTRTILPALVYYYLVQDCSNTVSSAFIKAVVDATVRD